MRMQFLAYARPGPGPSSAEVATAARAQATARLPRCGHMRHTCPCTARAEWRGCAESFDTALWPGAALQGLGFHAAAIAAYETGDAIAVASHLRFLRSLWLGER